MFSIKKWVNRQSEHPARRRLTPTGNDNEYDVARAEGIVMEDGDAFDADTMNDLETRIKDGFDEYDPGGNGVDVTVQPYTCTKSGGVYALTGSGAVGRCKIPAAWASGDTWTVNGEAVPAYCGADAVDGDCIVAGRWVLFTFDGAQLNFNGGGGLSSSKLAQATASEAQVLAGVPFYAGGKTLKFGSMRNNGKWPDADKLTIESGKLWMYKQDGYTEGGLGVAASNLGNAQADHILSGVSASSQNGVGFGGSMPNRSGWSASLAPGGYANIPKGYHDGNSGVSAKSIKTAYVYYSSHDATYPTIIKASGGRISYTIPSGTLIGITNVKIHSSNIEIRNWTWGFNPITISGNTISTDFAANGELSFEIQYAYYE